MSEALIQRIHALGDQKAIRLLEFYSQQVFAGTRTSPQEMIEAIPAELKAHAPFQKALAMSAQDSERALSEQQSATLARTLLLGLAHDPVLAPTLEQAMDKYKDNKLLAGAILATGVAVSMIIIAATTRFKANINGVEVEKETADASFIEALMKHFPSLGGG